MAQEKPLFTFAVIADAQYCNCETMGTRFYKKTPDKLHAAIDTINLTQPEFTIHLGDLIDRDFESYDTVLPILKKLKSKVYFVLGNHDFSVEDSQKDLVLNKLGMNHSYYTFKIKNIKFVVIDGTDFAPYRYSSTSPLYEKTQTELNQYISKGLSQAKPWNGAISNEQQTWLKNTLQQTTKDEKLILFCHYPIYPQSDLNLMNDQEILDIINPYKNKIIAWINGHNHQGNYAQFEGIHFLNLKGMLETDNINSFTIIEIYNNYLKINGYGDEPDRILNL